MIKERLQNAVIGDDVRLRLISYNSNLPANLLGVDRVDIFYLDPALCKDHCPDGGTLIESIPGSQVVQDGVGQYSVVFHPTSPKYIIGKYSDVWFVQTQNAGELGKVSRKFELYSDLWYFSTLPAVYSFDFAFQPNRIRKGSNKYLIIRITPNVPRASDLEVYYTNLAIGGNLYISMEKVCDPCSANNESDLNIVFERQLVDIREKVFGYYMLDTREMDCGIYNVWFELDFAGVTEVSPKSQLQIF